ncbi:MAG: acyl-CoA dehydrogenase family protein, partial [Fidelibacterota bacterium]
MKSQYFNEDHDMFRESIRKFVRKEVTPNADKWEVAGGFPKEIFKKMGKLGFLGINYPEEIGGSGLDFFFTVIFLEELCKCKMGGFPTSVAVHSYMATPPLLHVGSEYIKREYLIPAIKGKKIGALAVTEPGCGSDVAAISTYAVKDGDKYVINGAKTFITNGGIA